ncbi:transposase [Streptomyces iranensis]|uniref:Transposase n=1 Tax=Streptomyces iranensis TaxID=576784 RepID=A0ABS4N670_9ACTN|nr:transposase [Streptomyces iranensis]
MSDKEKDIEILVLRHQLLVLQRQVGKPSFTDSDRAILAGLLHHLPKDRLRHLLLLVSPETVLRWHRELLRRRHAATCVPRRRRHPRTIPSIRVLVLRLARENAAWGYRRIHGELAVLGIKVAASTVWEILREHGIPPAPERQSTTWGDFLRSQAKALLACDLFDVRTLRGRACTSSLPSSTPPVASGSSAPPHTPPRSGPCSSDATSSWISRTRAAR